MEALRAREALVRSRWLVAVSTGLGLVALKRWVEWPDPLVPNVLLYVLGPLALAWLLRYDLGRIGLVLPRTLRGWALTGLLLVGAVVFALAGTLFPDMMDYYPAPHWGPVEATVTYMMAYEAAMALVMLGTELLYRGWLVMAPWERLGRWAVLVSAVPYAAAHLGKPGEEVVFSLFAGVVFGLADIEARSIVPSLAGHFLGSSLFDCLALGA